LQTHLRATKNHLPYVITQYYQQSDTVEYAPTLTQTRFIDLEGIEQITLVAGYIFSFISSKGQQRQNRLTSKSKH